MTGLLLALALGAPPAAPPDDIMIATTRGELILPVRTDASGAPAVYASPLVLALGGTVKVSGAWAEVVLSGQPIRLLVGAPLYVRNNRVHPVAAPFSMLNDTLYVPLQFVAEELPRLFSERLRWDAEHARLVETGWTPPAGVAAGGQVELRTTPAPPARGGRRLPNGLREGHLVVVDPGHGGADNGNPGMFFPRGVREKHVTLQMGLLLREELQKEGVRVHMTRTTDVLPSIFRRAPQCGADCDLFVSLHVDALDPKLQPNYRNITGFHTLIIGEENTEDADRVARMENEAIRYEAASEPETTGDLGFILRDLQMNEFLRESARVGALIQQEIDPVHTGVNRGVKQSNRLAVLNTARRPAVLVELGFSTSPSDARLLTSAGSQRQLARALSRAIVQYLREYERRVGDVPVGAAP